MIRIVCIGMAVLTFAAICGCGGGRLIPEDITRLMESEGGRWALKSIEGHGGIWRWRSRPYVSFDYAQLTVARGVDTAITNRRRDTTITPRVDTLVNLRAHFTYDLQSGLAHARSASQSPLIQQGYDGQTVWAARDTVRSTDPAELASARALLDDVRFGFSLPFLLLDTTLQFTLSGDLPTVDTVIEKGKEPGTYDTTLTPYALKRLRVDFGPRRAPYPWAVFYLDERDGRVRRVLTPPDGTDSTVAAYITIWTDAEDILGLKVGGRRLTLPADPEGTPTGPFVTDIRYYGANFPRKLEEPPFEWVPPVAAPPDSLADSAAAPPGA